MSNTTGSPTVPERGFQGKSGAYLTQWSGLLKKSVKLDADFSADDAEIQIQLDIG